MQPLISVIVPVFNTKKYIAECLDSIINQDLKEIEIICINDGSTDGVESILEEYSTQDSRIKIINQENKGVSASRNAALNISQGKYLFFVDSDDFLFSNILSYLCKTAENLNVDILISKQKIFSDLDPNKYVIRGYNKDFLKKEENIVFSSREISNLLFQVFSSELHGKLFRTEFIKNSHLKFPQASVGEDYFFLYMSLMLTSKIVVCDILTYNYRRLRENSLTLQDDNILDFYKSLEALRNEMLVKSIYEIFKDSYEEYIIKQIYLNAKRASKKMQKNIFRVLEQKYLAILDKENTCSLTPLKELKYLYRDYANINLL